MDRPTLIVFVGLPGVGKSTASAYTADQRSIPRYRSDEVRKALFPEPSYSEAETAATYDELLRRARSDLEAGSDAVVDATFCDRRFRDQAAATAREAGATATFVHVTCPDDVVHERLERRSGSVSDADWDVYLQLKRSFDPIDHEHVEIDNAGSIAETERQLDRLVLGRPAESPPES